MKKPVHSSWTISLHINNYKNIDDMIIRKIVSVNINFTQVSASIKVRAETENYILILIFFLVITTDSNEAFEENWAS
jgi:hypothetical protein